MPNITCITRKVPDEAKDSGSNSLVGVEADASDLV